MKKKILQMVQITDYLHLGTYEDAKNESKLDEWHIGCVVNVAKECHNWYPKKYTYVNASFVDDTYIAKEDIDKIVDEIHQHISAKINVFVHCLMGKSRSVFIIACYLIKYTEIKKEDVLSFIQSKKTDICISEVFKILLNYYDMATKGEIAYDDFSMYDNKLKMTINNIAKREMQMKKLFDKQTNKIDLQKKMIIFMLNIVIGVVVFYLYW